MSECIKVSLNVAKGSITDACVFVHFEKDGRVYTAFKFRKNYP